MSVTKKLIEVALPLEAINHGCTEDKNRKTGHIRNLHKWFAPMPLPSWRAMLFAALVDDPSNNLTGDEEEQERARLFDIITRLSKFDSYKDKSLISEARDAISRSTEGTVPTIVDPFCGGGSTILEAQRLGLPTHASDLNQVPILITTLLCRVPALFAGRGPIVNEPSPSLFDDSGIPGFISDVKHYANLIRQRAWSRLSHLYPPVDGAPPFAYRWAWSVASPDPSVKGRLTPLVSNWWLSKHKKSKAYVKPTFENGKLTFQIEHGSDAPQPTTGRTAATCLFSDTPIPVDYIREEGRAGRLTPILFAIACKDGAATTYCPPNEEQVAAAGGAPETSMAGIAMPDAALGFRVQQYGIHNFLQLFSRRQAYALETFASLVSEIHPEILTRAISAGLIDDNVALEDGGSGARAYADAISAMLALCVGKMAQSNNILVRWFLDPRNGSGKATPAFDRHAVPMVWDFVETNPFGGSVGDWLGPVLETALRAFDLAAPWGQAAMIRRSDARDVADLLPRPILIATDPPYYANIGYADLSDFFYMWHREALRKAFPSLYGTVATPKIDELIATPFRHGGKIEKANEYFRKGFSDVFRRLGETVDPRFPMLIVYAIKQSEEDDEAVHSTGWEVFLGGLIDSGLAIVATWPVRTTTATRMIGIGNNALASAIFVVCRHRADNAPNATRREFMAVLKAELPIALKHLQAGNIPPVDLAQAAIGPGMSVFTRYSKVLDAEGNSLSVRTALALINQILDEALAEQEGEFDSDTRWALAWFEQVGFEEGEFGVAEQLSKAKNTSVSGMVEAHMIVAGKGRVRLLKAAELSQNWSPLSDPRRTVWKMVHHLVRMLEIGGESAAAQAVLSVGEDAESVRDLCYRLYTICERKKRPQEAILYNALVQSWPEITRLSREAPRANSPSNIELFERE